MPIKDRLSNALHHLILALIFFMLIFAMKSGITSCVSQLTAVPYSQIWSASTPENQTLSTIYGEAWLRTKTINVLCYQELANRINDVSKLVWLSIAIFLGLAIYDVTGRKFPIPQIISKSI